MFLLRPNNADYALADDLSEAEAMGKALERYLKNDVLYDTIGGGIFGSGSMPALTLGAFVMRLRRLRVLFDQLTEPQRRSLEALDALNAGALENKRTRYEKKIVYEANSRLKAMAMFFEECRANPRGCASIYKPEALRRTVIEEIRLVMAEQHMESAELEEGLRKTDSRLRGVAPKSGFLWDAQLQPAYPESRFWWLYALPQGS